MTESLPKLIESLRDELKCYGEMLALLDRQQEYLRDRATPEISQSAHLVHMHGLVIQQARLYREACRREIATATGCTERAGFSSLIPLIPAVYRPLLKALVNENNELLLQVRRRARQNHFMLKRSLESMQEVVKVLRDPVPPEESNSIIHLPVSRQLQQELN